MEKILTAEEYFNKYADLCQFEEGPTEYLVDRECFKEAMIEFAKMHVAEALKEVSEKAQCENGAIVDLGFEIISASVDKDSILNSYSLSNIK